MHCRGSGGTGGAVTTRSVQSIGGDLIVFAVAHATTPAERLTRSQPTTAALPCTHASAANECLKPTKAKPLVRDASVADRGM